jgi:hypothetical protein
MTNLPQIDFPDFDKVPLNGGVKFDGFIPKNIIPEGDSLQDIFEKGIIVGLFSNTDNPSTGPEWGLTTGGVLKAEAFIDQFVKTSEDSSNIYGTMRLIQLIPPVTNTGSWKSLTENGLTGWSIRTSVGDYFGEITSLNILTSGNLVTLCIGSAFGAKNPAALQGPTGENNNYLFYRCTDLDGSAATGATASVGEIFVQSGNLNSSTFNFYQCIDGGSDASNPAVFTGPFEAPSTYFTSTESLTTGIRCDYQYIWNWGPKWQQWKFDCGVSAWLTDGASITEGGNGPQGPQGAQGLQGEDAVILSGFDGPDEPAGIEGQYWLDTDDPGDPTLYILVNSSWRRANYPSGTLYNGLTTGTL